MSLSNHYKAAIGIAALIGVAVGALEAVIMTVIHAQPLDSMMSSNAVTAFDAGSIGLCLSIACYLAIRYHAKSCTQTLVDCGLSLAALESLGKGVVITNQQGKILFINTEFESITGYSRRDVAGQTPAILQSGRQSAEFYSAMWQDLKKYGRWRGTLWNKRKNGELYHERLNIRRFTIPSGDIGYIGVFADINEQDKLERALIDAQKHELMAMLTGSLAHNFNNFLSVIQGQASLGELDATHESRQYFSEILSASDRAAELVRDMMAISRYGTKDMAVFDLAEVVKQTAHTCKSIVPANIMLTTDLPAGSIGSVMGNASDIEQTILNLVSNARDAMEGRRESSITLRLTPSCKGDPTCRDCCPNTNACPVIARSTALLIVEDNGPGIPEAVQQEVFAPFFTTKEAGKGTGLGLASARHIADRHGGVIWLESVKNSGARFLMCLPLIDEESRHDGQPQPASGTTSPFKSHPSP